MDKIRTLRFKDRMCVPNNEEIKKMILKEAHKSKLSIHPTKKKKCIKISRKYIGGLK